MLKLKEVSYRVEGENDDNDIEPAGMACQPVNPKPFKRKEKSNGLT
jgi:hypothetical protein